MQHHEMNWYENQFKIHPQFVKTSVQNAIDMIALPTTVKKWEKQWSQTKYEFENMFESLSSFFNLKAFNKLFILSDNCSEYNKVIRNTIRS